MQFKVPQFLDIEDKIFGPFTFRQFVYLAGGAGLCFILYRAWGFWLGAIPIAAIAGFALALTFYRPNNKPFIHMLEASFKYALQSKLYIWKKSQGKIAPLAREGVFPSPVSIGANGEAKLNRSKLQDLAWSLDVLDLKKEESADSL